MTPLNKDQDLEDLVRRRQRARAIVMAVLLLAFVVLTFAVSIVKIAQGHK